MFVSAYPSLEIETKVGLRYKPDLIAISSNREFEFWGECGQNSIHKTLWILKHTRTKKLVLFKIGINTEQLIKHLRGEIPLKYRADGRLALINFVSEIVNLTARRQISKVERDWFNEYKI